MVHVTVDAQTSGDGVGIARAVANGGVSKHLEIGEGLECRGEQALSLTNELVPALPGGVPIAADHDVLHIGNRGSRAAVEGRSGKGESVFGLDYAVEQGLAHLRLAVNGDATGGPQGIGGNIPDPRDVVAAHE